MREIPADADAVAKAVGGGPARIGALVVEANVTVDEIANGLDELSAGAGGPAELDPREIAEVIGVAVAARQQKAQHIDRQFRDRSERRVLGVASGRPESRMRKSLLNVIRPGPGSTRVTRLSKESI